MTAPLRISPADPSEISELVQLVNSAYRGEASAGGWTTEAHLLTGPRTDAAALQELLAAPDAAILTARSASNELVGCVYVKPQAQQLYLGMLAVAPEQQAAGIGKALLQAAEEFARQHGCNTITITVLSARPELLAWYQRHGYAPTGATEAFPDDPRFGTPRQELELLVLNKPLAFAAL